MTATSAVMMICPTVSTDSPIPLKLFRRTANGLAENALLYSRATFKVIVVGSQVLNPLNRFECFVIIRMNSMT